MATATNLTIYGNGVNLGCAFTSMDVAVESEIIDNTRLCNTAKTFVQGFKSGTVSASGVFEYDATSVNKIHNALASAFADSATVVLTSSLEALSVGGDAILLDANVPSYGVEMPLGQLVMSNAEFQATNGILFGKWLVGSAVAGGTTNGTSVDNSVSSANGGFGQCHVVLDGAATVTVKIQHSSNGSTWVDLVSFGDLERDLQGVSQSVTGTVNRYLRVNIVSDGNANVFVAFARK